MKKLTFLTIAIVFSCSLQAQKLDASKVPDAVKKSFTNKYPGIENANWEKENGQFEASYKKDGQSYSAMFTPDGTFTESEIDIKVTDLPEAATAYLKDHYKGTEIKEASKITRASGEINYEAAIKGKDVIFDDKGKFLKTVKD
jgi:hypothetical protein